MADEDLFVCNGVDAETGNYLIAPMSFAELAKKIRQPITKAEADAHQRLADAKKPDLGGRLDENLQDVKQGGWAVVFHKDEDTEVRRALDPLVRHRLEQIGNDRRVKILDYAGESTPSDWLKMYGVEPGDIEPWRIPYYLLVVGSPERIPFKFSQDLAMLYAVGLLHFDQPADYLRYVDSLIAYERGEAEPCSREALFFRTQHDRSTKESALNLIQPLTDGTSEQDDGAPAEPPIADHEGFYTHRIWDAQATKNALVEVFAPSKKTRPAFLFTASHGTGRRQPTPEQMSINGALRCQDGALFSAQTLSETPGVRVHGLIAFLFACYSAGTPDHDQFPLRSDRIPVTIAEKPFIAALPKALLSHPQGGALACIGHVERAWSYSFRTKKLGHHLIPYRNAVQSILRGKPVGLALKDMRDRFAPRDNELVQMLFKEKFGLNVDDRELVTAWCQRNEAGGYILIGDPAAALHRDSLEPVLP